MKALTSFLALTFTVATSVRGQVPENERPIVVSTRLKVTAAIVAASGKLGTPIAVQLVSRNVSSKVVRVIEIVPELDYELVVMDSSGKKLSPTAFLDRMLHTNYDFGSRDPRRELEPGDEVRTEIAVTKIYQINQPGVYYLWATRDPSDDEVKKATLRRIEASFRTRLFKSGPVHDRSLKGFAQITTQTGSGLSLRADTRDTAGRIAAA
jgi:hypothetical protein